MLNSILLMAVFQGANCITIISTIIYITKVSIDVSNRIFSYMMVLMIITLVYDYYSFFKNFKNIEKKYENESSLSKRIGKIILYVYIIITFLLFFKTSNFPYYLEDGTEMHRKN
jgi:ABC-type siderophore export system fused ATPase/permease subunit